MNTEDNKPLGIPELEKLEPINQMIAGIDVFVPDLTKTGDSTKDPLNVPRPIGRPTEYTPELATEICALLSEGISLRKVCEREDMPSKTTIFNWFRTKHEFVDQYARAKELGSEAQYETLEDLGDQAIDLAQEVDPKASGAVVQAVKLKADNLKWMMSKMKPKKYGDKVDVTTAGEAIKGNIIVFKDFSDESQNQN